ncbi:MAG: hypothetical protein HUJ90_07290 [Bacteroidales bacterium]|nr:hypothetical protein [Bacteroidales bacterium]
MFPKRLYNRIISLALLCAGIFLTSCINTNYTIGSDLVPTNQNLKIRVGSFDIKVGEQMADSLQSTAYYLMFGNNVDELYGLTTIDLAATVTPADSAMRFPADILEIKEAYITLVNTQIDTFQPEQENIFQNIYVYQLNRPLDTTDVYSNSVTDEDHFDELVNKPIFYDGSDSLIVNIDKELALYYLTATNEELDSLALYQETHYGLYFKAEMQAEGVLGGRINGFTDGSFTIRYSFRDSLGFVRDTTNLFTLGDVNYGLAVCNFKHSTADMAIGSDNDLELLFFEGLAGIKPHISALDIKDAISKWAADNNIDLSKLLLSRAIVNLPFEAPEVITDLDKLPTRLYPCRRSTTVNNYINYAPLYTIYDSTFDRGDIDRVNLTYHPDITMYLQDLIRRDRDKVEKSDDLWIMSIYEYVQQSSSSSSSSSMYDYYNMYNYYNMYGGGYDSYGYGSYDDYYYYMMYSQMSSSSSSQSSSYYYVDYINYSMGYINGNAAKRHPSIEITYTIVED